ncbi:hypothetical protein BH11PLA2_BH11PLA2_30750 [soil metagenome]
MTVPPEAVETPPPPPPAVIDPQTPGQWPKWLPGLDRFTLVLLLIVAALTASHVARNSDAWLHLAAGRDFLNGKYTLGKDPYSYTGAERYWANANWLTDVAAYQLWKASPSGTLLVLLKAILFAGAFALVLRIRKPETSAWPWCVTLLLGVLAAAPHSGLRPMVLSAFLLALTLLILFGVKWKAGSWRKPLLLAGLFALWANLDGWFLLGPITVLVTLLGELLQRQLFGTIATDDAPATKDLLRTLLLGTLATLVNPHHINIWQAPAELGINLPASVKLDPNLKQLVISPITSDYTDSAALGKNANGLAFAVLFLAGGALLALGFARVRLSYLFVWIVFAGLALLQFRLILFFAIVAVPLVGMALGELAGRVTLGAVNEQSTKLKVLFASLLRPALVVAPVIAGVCAWAGWIHPKPADPANTNRVDLGMEADAGLERTAKVVQQWRQDARLPDTAHGVYLSLELANYVAWFAPGERVSMNNRLPFHLPELAALLDSRRSFIDSTPEAMEKVRASLKPFNASFLLTASNQHKPLELQIQLPHISLLRYLHGEQALMLMHLDGRSVVMGEPLLRSAKFDPSRLAFTERESAPPEPVLQPAPERMATTDIDDFLMPAKAVPLAALDALVWGEYTADQWQRRLAQYQNNFAITSLGLVGAGPLVAMQMKNTFPVMATPDDLVALNLMTIRAARRGIAANPDHPLAYFALGQAYLTRNCPMPGFDPNDSQSQMATAFRRYLDRMPLPKAVMIPHDALDASQAANALAEYLRTTQAADLERDAMKLFADYQFRLIEMAPRISEDQGKQLKAEAENLGKMIGEMDRRFAPRLERYQSTAGRPAKERLQAAMQLGLKGEAIKLIATSDLDKEFGPEARDVELFGVSLRLQAGQLEAAFEAFSKIPPKIEAMAESKDPRVQQQFYILRQKLTTTQIEIQHLSGDDAALIAFFEKNAPKPLTVEEKAAVTAAIPSIETFVIRTNGLGHMALGGYLGFEQGMKLEAFPVKAWLDESELYTRLGLLNLLEGRNDEARKRFEQALKPEGIAVPDFLQGQHVVPDRYLKMMGK